MKVEYPPAPWRLWGEAIVTLRAVSLDTARALTPAGLRVVPVLPGKTLAALYCARYGSRSTLSYHELIVAPALVCSKGRVGFWISHIYVDDPASMAAGREIWGLPKELAKFEWAPKQGYARVERDAACLCEVRWSPRPARLPMPLLAPAFGAKGFIHGTGMCSLTRCPAAISIPARAPFAALSFQRSTAAYFAPQLRLKIPA
jgi:acetoacetate decarboxylase